MLQLPRIRETASNRLEASPVWGGLVMGSAGVTGVLSAVHWAVNVTLFLGVSEAPGSAG